MKVISLIGARPQFIKASVVSEALSKTGVKEVIVNSGQHYDANMSDVFFNSLKIPAPGYNLSVGSGSHGAMTAKIMIAFEEVVLAEKPDCIIVYGDTNTTLAGALVAAKLKIPTAHIEAGVRMLPKDMPEEINRVLVDRVSKLLFCPTQKAVQNLRSEGIVDGVYFVGDVMYDVFLKIQPAFKHDLIHQYGLTPGNYVVATIHRDYNVDKPDVLKKILQQLSAINDECKVVFSIHPRTRKRIEEYNLKEWVSDLVITEPLDYPDLMGLIDCCKNVVTDSGGLQKESYFAQKQSVVVMPDTGWQELIDRKINMLSSPDCVYNTWKSLSPNNFEQNIYGSGESAQKISDILTSYKF